METKSYETCRADNSEPEQIKTGHSVYVHQHSKTCTQNIHCIYCNINVALAYIASTADVTLALTIIIPDGDVCFIKAWSHYNSSLATRISKGDLELFVSLHNELICHPNYKLDSSLMSRDGHLSGESGSREINTSCRGEWKAGDTQPSMCDVVTNDSRERCQPLHMRTTHATTITSWIKQVE